MDRTRWNSVYLWRLIGHIHFNGICINKTLFRSLFKQIVTFWFLYSSRFVPVPNLLLEQIYRKIRKYAHVSPTQLFASYRVIKLGILPFKGSLAFKGLYLESTKKIFFWSTRFDNWDVPASHTKILFYYSRQIINILFFFKI